ncbi:MAG: carbohydrate ABC transporter permease [Chloroflexota bacterium]
MAVLDAPAVAMRRRSGVTARYLVGRSLSHLLMIALSVVMVVPFYIMVVTSFMSLGQAYSFPPSFLPSPFIWSNYPNALALEPFGRYFLNSTVVAILITAVRLLSCSLGAYAFARLVFPGRDLIFYVYLSTLMIPEHVTLIPLFLIMRVLGWIDTYQGLTVPFFVSAFGVFLLRQFFLTIPREIEEAAVIDGCGSFGVFWQIILPLARPGLAALAILSFVASWNQFIWPLIVTNSDQMRTMVVGIGMLSGNENQIANWPYVMVVATVAVVPSLIAFAFGQRYFVQGITLSGLKG